MIEADKRKAIYLLHQEGMSIRQIAQRLRVSRHTVRRMIQEQGQMPAVVHADKKQIDEQLLRDLYRQCQGRIRRMHELLVEEHKIPVELPDADTDAAGTGHQHPDQAALRPGPR